MKKYRRVTFIPECGWFKRKNPAITWFPYARYGSGRTCSIFLFRSCPDRSSCSSWWYNFYVCTPYRPMLRQLSLKPPPSGPKKNSALFEN